MDVIPIITCALLAVLVGMMLDAAVQLRRIHSALALHHRNVESFLHYFLFEKDLYSDYRPKEHDDSGFCVWVYHNGQWKVAADYSREGFEPGPPPSYKGSCEGYAVKQPSVKIKP